MRPRCFHTGRFGRAAAVAAAALALGGCAPAEPWAWTGPEPLNAPGVAPAHTNRDGASVLVFPRSGFIADARPETARRDALLGAGPRAEALPDRLAWPEPERPSLDRTRSVRTSPTPERWMYPTTRRDSLHVHRRTYRHH